MERKLKYELSLDFFKKRWILKIISFYFIFLFVYTGLSKLIDNQSLFIALRNAPLFLQSSFASILSWGVPIVEIGLAMMLGFKKISHYGWTGVIILLTLFTFYTGWIVLVSPYEPCTCGGLMTLLSWKQHLTFNISSLLLACWGYHIKTQEGKK